MSERMTRITCTDVDTGESETTEIPPHSFTVICGGDRYVSNEQHYYKSGTTVLTIKRHDTPAEQTQ